MNKEKNNDLFALLGAWNKRWFTFDGTNLVYYQDQDALGPSGSISIKDIKGVKPMLEVPGFIFQVFTTKRPYKFQAFDEVERNRWVIALQNAVNAKEKAQDNAMSELKVAKEAVSQLSHFDIHGAAADAPMDEEQTQYDEETPAEQYDDETPQEEEQYYDETPQHHQQPQPKPRRQQPQQQQQYQHDEFDLLSSSAPAPAPASRRPAPAAAAAAPVSQRRPAPASNAQYRNPMQSPQHQHQPQYNDYEVPESRRGEPGAIRRKP